MSPGLIVWLLSLLLGMQPLTTDLYLPALPALTQGFGAGMAQAQLTLTALLLAFGCSQLFWGPLSDRFGRRPILLWGLAAYALAAVACALAPSMSALIFWRAVQGAAMGAGVMGARAIVRDLYAPLEGARVMSKGLTGLGLIACLSAPLGSVLAELLGWRAVLFTLVLTSSATLALIAWRFDETVPRKNPKALQFATLARTWWHIVRHPSFVAFTALTVCSYAGLFTFLASSSFVFIRVLGLSPLQYGVVIFSSSLSYILGTLLCRRWLARHGVRRTVAFAGALSLTGGTLMGSLSLLSDPSVWTLMPPFCLFMVAHGIHNPCGQSGSVGPFAHAAGAASALNGFLITLVAFGVGSWLGWRMDGTVAPLAQGVWFWSAGIALTAWTLVQRHERAVVVAA